MSEQVAEKTEVMKLGANLNEEQRAELENFEKHVKSSIPDKPGQTNQIGNVQVTEDSIPEQEEEPEVKQCLRCGYKEGDPAATEEDMKEYMRCILGQKRFSKKYKVMRGQIAVKFTTIDGGASERVNKIIDKLSVLEDPVAFRAVATKINMAYMLTSYQVAGETVDLGTSNAETPEDVIKDFAERFGNMDETVIQMFTRKMGEFIVLKNALIDECSSEAF
jgi:hypothetical protein